MGYYMILYIDKPMVNYGYIMIYHLTKKIAGNYGCSSLQILGKRCALIHPDHQMIYPLVMTNIAMV